MNKLKEPSGSFFLLYMYMYHLYKKVHVHLSISPIAKYMYMYYNKTIEKEQRTEKQEVHTMKNQKELKAIYRAELAKAWADPKMIDFCAKHTAYIFEHNGKLFGIDKPSIQTRFCFGAGMNASCTQEEMQDAYNAADFAKSSADYFIRENMEDLDRIIKSLEEIKHNTGLNWCPDSCPRYMVKARPHYCSQTADCKLANYDIIDTNWQVENAVGCWDIELIDKLIAGYEEVKKDFGKRLQTYLKRYGLTKIDTWTYIRD